MSNVATNKTGVWRRLFGFLKPWIAFSGLYAAFSICPFCGQNGCPVGIGSAGIVGGLMALCMQKWGMLFGRMRGCKHWHIINRQNEIVKGTGSMTYLATEIEAGYHPLGYKIDKGADPMNRYTQWKIDANGKWVDSKPVCFHSLPAEGWIKVEKSR